MSNKRYASYRKILEQRENLVRQEIAEELRRSGEEQYADLAGSVTDSGDQSVATLLADLDNAMVKRQVDELRDIEEAYKRIDSEDYGDCIECGGEILPERLRAYPTAKRCIECQSQHEKTFAQSSRPSL